MIVLEVTYGTRRFWTPSERVMNEWILKTLGRLVRPSAGVIEPMVACKVVSLVESRRLNRQYRGKDKPTNVLSFAVSERLTPNAFLGDLAICPAVLANEAREQKKALSAHWAHLMVHGTLHLMGFDHLETPQAMLMERREVKVLKSLGFANPYRSRA
jgi:probable rRNA maturation factor